MTPAVPPVPLASNDALSFWQIGSEVYRVPASAAAVAGNPSAVDIYGCPLGRRWECSLAHWKHYRAVFSFVQDVPPSSQEGQVLLSA